MKLTILFFASALPALAQTNLGTISFTNGSQTVTNARVSSFDASRVYYRTAGGGGSVLIVALHSNEWPRFNFNMDAAVSSEIAKLMREADYRDAVARRLAAERRAAEIKAASVLIQGEVAQVHLNAGLRVRFESYRLKNYDLNGQEVFIRMGLNTNYGEKSPVNLTAWPDGTFTYNTVAGSTRTLKAFTLVPPSP